MNSKINLRFSVLTTIILLGAFSRMIPHPVNFTPIGAMVLFGAAHFSKKWQIFLIPIIATWLSDLFINNVIYKQYYTSFTWFYEGFSWLYLSYLLIALFSIQILKKVRIERVLIGALGSTLIFFLLSNVGCFIGNTYYAQNFSGLITCYAAGLPFILGTLSGNIFYSIIFFGVFHIAQSKFPALKEIGA